MTRGTAGRWSGRPRRLRRRITSRPSRRSAAAGRCGTSNTRTTRTPNMSSHTAMVGDASRKRPWTPAKVGMLAFLVSESAFFSALLMVYAFYLDQIRQSSPGPGKVLTWSLVIPGTLCLLASSLTVHLAEGALHKGKRGGFLLFWGMTIVLGVLFLILTAMEWKELIGKWGL